MARRGRAWRSGVCGIDDGFVWGGPSPVPAAGATLLPDAGVVFGLVARVAESRGHVGPDTLVLGADEARRVIAGLDLQLGNRHRLADSAMVDAGLMPAQGRTPQNLGPRQGEPSHRGSLVQTTYYWLTPTDHLLCARHSAKGCAMLFSFILLTAISPFYKYGNRGSERLSN